VHPDSVSTPLNEDSVAHAAAVAEEQLVLDEAFDRRDEILRHLDSELAIPARDATESIPGDGFRPTLEGLGRHRGRGAGSLRDPAG
jgi:hypothetical protein